MLIQTEHLKLTLNQHAILKDVNLHLEAGEVYGLLGPNGAGKSSTIACLLGLYPIDDGKMSLLDNDHPGKDVLGKIGVMPENAGFYEWMNAQQYLQWYAELFGRDLDQKAISQLLSQVGLEQGSSKIINQYSRGMKQRLALARALINEPVLLILDETTNGLDPKGRREIHDLLLKLAKQNGVGILLCTHLLDDVDRLCDHIGIIQDGRTLIESPINTLISDNQTVQRYRVRFKHQQTDRDLMQQLNDLDEVISVEPEGGWWHLQLAKDASVSRVWRKILDLGLDLHEIRPEGNGLEDVYLSLTGTPSVIDNTQQNLEAVA